MIQEHAPLRQEDQFRELLGVLRRRKAIVIAVTVLFALFGIVSVMLAPASYQVVKRVLIREYSNGATGRPVDPADQLSQVSVPMEIGAQMGLIQGPDVLGAAFQSAGVPPPTADATETPVAINQELAGPVLNIIVNQPNPDDAVRLADAIPAAYNNYVNKTRSDAAQKTVQNQKARLDQATTKLRAAELAFNNEVKNQGGTLVAQGGAEGIERTSRLNTYQQQLDTARVSLASAERQLAESIAARDRIPMEIQDTNVRPSIERIATQERTIADLEGQLKALLVTETEANPEVKALRARLNRELQYQKTLPPKTVGTTLIRNPERLAFDSRVTESKIGVASAKVQVDKLQALVEQERAGLADYQRRVPKQQELQAAVDQQRGIVSAAAQAYAVAQQNKEALDNQITGQYEPLKTIATSGATRTSPVVTRTIISSTILGLVFGVMLALLRDRFDNRIYTLEQIYDVSGAVPIGQVPSSTKALTGNVRGQSRNRVLESYRSLRFNLESSAPGGSAQSVLVASASAGEGRAGLSFNLATEAATDARKTILVDGDMRTPELHDVLKLKRGPGLSDVLSGTIGLDEVLQATSQDNLLFLSSGSEHPIPLELLTGPAFASLHEALKERADVIVFNSPSLMRYTDGRAIAKVADSVLFVAKRGFTRRDAMRYCIGMLRRTQARLLGVVLSDESGRTTDVPYYATE